MGNTSKISYTKFAEKQLTKLPAYISEALFNWARAVELGGIQSVRQIKGYHDEPLSGKRKGQRSIRLNRAYRAIYIEMDNEIELLVIEVSKHDYKK